MNSVKIPSVKNLQNPREAKRFLIELANMGDSSQDAEHFWQECKDSFPPSAFRLNEEVEAVLPSDRPWQHEESGWLMCKELSQEEKLKARHRVLITMRDQLREAWTIADLRRKEWKLFQLRTSFHQHTVASLDQMTEPPPPSGMDYALRYLCKVADKAQYCANPDCTVAPYFLVERRGRRFCSETCARPAQQAYKQRWWDEHRAEINKARKRSRQ